ncbi:TerB N-terminal domain-containing protein [Eubacterium callanderi]|uniref:TerB N-terminal domain-containing protein n=1 Tax=Eubacterium callanderi TaxID=53442 RepID=UPI003AF0DA16
MKNNKEFVKSTKLVSRIFMAIWLFMCMLITLSFLVGSSKENIVSDIAFLIVCYILFSAMFLVPAITITQAQRAKVSKVDTCYSEKSYRVTLLLAIFFGTFGIHRFYTGRKLTGVLYLFTFGGVGIGWIVDIILVATGMFLDKEGHIIRLPGHGKQEPNIRPQSVEVCEVPKDSVKLQKAVENETVKSTLFSDIVIPGDAEKKQEIPVMPSGQDTFCEQPSFSVTISATEALKNEVSLYTTRSYTGNSSAKFFSDMKKYADTVGQKAEFVPFMQYWPTYDSMDRRQRAWYFYWRTQVRKGEYPDTDLSYIFVHIYELLSGCGWKQASDGYSQLMSLWMSYRERFPQMDHYLFGWIFDFAKLYQLDFTMPEICNFQLPSQAVIRDLLLDQHSDEKPLRLPFPLICSLCDYSIMGSKFYKDGHQQLMQEAIPRVVALADAVLLKEKGRGIFAIYGPNRPRKQSYYAFQSAVCPEANKRIDLSVKAYSVSTRLRNYVNQLVRYSENVLRSLYGYRGRLRGVELEPELSSLVESFLKKEYTPKENAEKAPPKQVEVKLDFDSIASLRAQSDAVRDALEVADEGTQKELLTELPEISAMFAQLSKPAQKFLLSLKATGWESCANTEASTFIEKINSAAARFIARALIVTEAGRYIVEDDYRDELDYIYENTPESELAAQQETATETEMRDAKLDGIGLPEELKQFLEALTDIQRQALQAILFSDDPQEKLTQLAEEAMSMPEILIDEINDVATQFLDDILIDTFDDTPTVLEQYADELKRAVKLLGVE